jgi:hypothetical protein
MRIGPACKLYYSSVARLTWSATLTAGIYTGPAPTTLVLIGGVTDLDIQIEKDKITADTRDSNFSQTAGGIIKVGATFKLRKDLTNAAQLLMLANAIQIGSLAAESLPIAILDGSSSVVGVYGWWLDAVILKFSESQKLKGEPVMFDCEIAHSAWTALDPQAVKVTT